MKKATNMAEIPRDAADWDSGDWLEWHRSKLSDAQPPIASASDDPSARLHSMFEALIHSARTFHTLTGRHVPVFQSIAEIYAATHFGVPLTHAAEQPSQGSVMSDGTCVLAIPPSAPGAFTVDLSAPFRQLLAVRITDRFNTSGRLVDRAAVEDGTSSTRDMFWNDLRPHQKL